MNNWKLVYHNACFNFWRAISKESAITWLKSAKWEISKFQSSRILEYLFKNFSAIIFNSSKAFFFFALGFELATKMSPFLFIMLKRISLTWKLDNPPSEICSENVFKALNTAAKSCWSWSWLKTRLNNAIPVSVMTQTSLNIFIFYHLLSLISFPYNKTH